MMTQAYHPLTIMRLWPGQFLTPDAWGRTLDMLKCHPAAFDEIWLCTAIHYPDLATHQAHADAAAHAAEKGRAAGFLMGLQIANTIGHRECPMPGNTADTFQRLVGHDGIQAPSCFCPRCPELQAYFKRVSTMHAAWQPSSVWIDDDLRMDHHPPVSYGCFCPRCLDAFSIRTEQSWDRPALTAALHESEGGSLRQSWTLFNETSMADLATAIAEGVHATSPHTLLAVQSCGQDFSLYNGRNSSVVFEALHNTTGLPVGNRPGVGVYVDHAPREIITKAFALGRAKAVQPDSVSITTAEVENTPHVSMGKTPQGTAIESSLDLALGCNSLSYAIICNQYETDVFYTSLIERIAQYRPFWAQFLQKMSATYPGGLNIALSDQHVTRPLTASEASFDWAHIDLSEVYQMSTVGLPLTPDPRGAQATLLHATTVAGFSDAELESFFTGGVIMDGVAALQLQARGLGNLLGTEVSPFSRTDCLERFTDDPINADFEQNIWRWTALGHASDDALVHVAPEHRVVTRFEDPNGASVGAGTVLIENPLGGRTAIFGRYPWRTTISSALRLQMLRAANWVCRERLPVILETAAQVVLVPRVDASGTLKGVFLLNATIDTTPALTLSLVEWPSSTATWHPAEGKAIPLTLLPEESRSQLVLPGIPPWSVGFLSSS